MIESKEFGIVSVFVTEDKMKAFLSIALNFEDADQVRNDIHHLLKETDIIFGIKEDIIDHLCANKKIASNVLIAEGLFPINGVDGTIAYHFETNHMIVPKLNDDGSVDYHDMGYVESANKDELLIELTTGTDGVDGMDVEGTTLPCINGKMPLIRVGKNCHASDDQLKIYADTDGIILFDNNTIGLSTTLEINEDVGIGTGDIVFKGEVKVHGNVLAGSQIKCNKLTIDGVVEDAKLFVNGDVEIQKGIQGHQHTSVDCLGNLQAKYITNADITTHGSIYTDMLINSHVHCDHEVIVSGKKGCIIGGDIIANGNIHAKTIGSELGVSTHFVLGEMSHLMAKKRELESLITEYNGAIEKTDQCLLLLDKKLAQMPNNERFHTLKLQYTKNKFMTKNLLNQKQKAIDELNKKMIDYSSITLSADKVFPGIHIQSGSQNMNIEEEQKHCTIRCFKDQLMMQN